MALVAPGDPPSTLVDVIANVRDAFGAIGNATPIMVGKHYLDTGAGVDSRVVFVPETRGRVGRAIEMGGACSITHSCDVYVRAAENADDVERLRAAYALADLVIDCVATAAPGRVDWGDYGDGSPTDTDAFGAEIAFSFTYSRDVRHDAARWSLPANAPASTPAPPLVPPGTAGSVNSIAATTIAPQE